MGYIVNKTLEGAAAREWICGLGLGLFENVLRRGAGDLRLTNGITGSSDAGNSP